MALELRDNGEATFSTHSNLGNSDLDKKVQASMSLGNARWTQDSMNLLVTGTQADGKPATYRFVIQSNGELLWDKNGARFVKTKAK